METSLKDKPESFRLSAHPPAGNATEPYPKDVNMGSGLNIEQFTLHPKGFAMSNATAFGKLEGCALVPNTRTIANPQLCQELHPGIASLAQYRVMSSYGLGQITYWSYLNYPELKNESGEYRQPEALYDPDLNLQITAKALGEARCYYHRDTTLGTPPRRYHDLPYLPSPIVNPYLGARGADDIQTVPDIVVTELEYAEWKKTPSSSYQGSYTNLHRQFERWLRPVGKYNGRYSSIYDAEEYVKTVRPFFILVQPTNLAKILVLRPAVIVEVAPLQKYKAEIYSAQDPRDPKNTNYVLAYKDAVELPCPLPNDQVPNGTMPKPSGLAKISAQQTNEDELELDRTQVDLQNNGSPILVVLTWSQSGEQFEKPGTIRFYSDPEGQNLLWETHTTVPVLSSVSVSTVTNPANGERWLKAVWAVGAHSKLTHFIRWSGTTYTLVPFLRGDGMVIDHLPTDVAVCQVLCKRTGRVTWSAW